MTREVQGDGYHEEDELNIRYESNFFSTNSKIRIY